MGEDVRFEGEGVDELKRPNEGEGGKGQLRFLMSRRRTDEEGRKSERRR